MFGSPTYMGGVAAQFKAFVDAASSIWFAQGWKDKIAGGFTHSSSLSGDKQGTLLYLSINAAQHSMIWVGAGQMPGQDGMNRLGSFMGVMGQSDMDMSRAPATIAWIDRSTSPGDSGMSGSLASSDRGGTTTRAVLTAYKT